MDAAELPLPAACPVADKETARPAIRLLEDIPPTAPEMSLRATCYDPPENGPAASTTPAPVERARGLSPVL